MQSGTERKRKRHGVKLSLWVDVSCFQGRRNTNSGWVDVTNKQKKVTYFLNNVIRCGTPLNCEFFLTKDGTDWQSETSNFHEVVVCGLTFDSNKHISHY